MQCGWQDGSVVTEVVPQLDGLQFDPCSGCTLFEHDAEALPAAPQAHPASPPFSQQSRSAFVMTLSRSGLKDKIVYH